jgi:hypothetical protein
VLDESWFWADPEWFGVLCSGVFVWVLVRQFSWLFFGCESCVSVGEVGDGGVAGSCCFGLRVVVVRLLHHVFYFYLFLFLGGCGVWIGDVEVFGLEMLRCVVRW